MYSGVYFCKTAVDCRCICAFFFVCELDTSLSTALCSQFLKVQQLIKPPVWRAIGLAWIGGVLKINAVKCKIKVQMSLQWWQRGRGKESGSWREQIEKRSCTPEGEKKSPRNSDNNKRNTRRHNEDEKVKESDYALTRILFLSHLRIYDCEQIQSALGDWMFLSIDGLA